MVPEKVYTPREVCNELSRAIRERVDAYKTVFEKLRKRELSAREKKLQKSNLSLCPTCGNQDSPDTCICLGDLRKNALMGYPAPPKTPGMQPPTPKTPVPGSHGAPAGMAKDELCKDCGKAGALCKCMGKTADLWSPESDTAGKVRGSVLDRTAGAKKDPVPAGGQKKRSASEIRGVNFDTGQLGKEEKAPGAKLPPEKGGKKAEASKGSGGQVKKGKKLSKAVAPAPVSAPPKWTRPAVAGQAGIAAPAKKPVPLGDLQTLSQGSPKPAAAGLPGMTPPPGAGLSQESAQSIHEAKLLAGLGTAVGSSGKPVPFVKKPGADEVAPGLPPGPRKPPARRFGSAERGAAGVGPKMGVGGSAEMGANLAADKRGGGVGFVNNLMSRIKGSPLFRAEPTSPEQANKEIGKFKSLASPQGPSRSDLHEPKDFPSEEADHQIARFRSLLGECPFCLEPEHPFDCTTK